MNLQEAQDSFRKALTTSAVCPVCTRYAEVYPYSVGTMLAQLLGKLSVAHGSQWVPLRKFPLVVTPKALKGKFVTNYNMLKHFGLLEPNKDVIGEWRVTEFGHQFVRGEVTVATRILVCLDQCLCKSIEQISFDEATQTKRARKTAMSPCSVDLPELTEGDRTLPLEDVVNRHRVGVNAGLKCVLCGRWNQVYHRALNSDMARVLICMDRLTVDSPQTFLHVYNDVGARGGEYAQMEYWQLIERHTSQEGYWRITQHGRDFVNGSVKVPARTITLNDAHIGFSDKLISIEDATKTKFNQEQLMAAAA